jgi:hypothetical protein
MSFVSNKGHFSFNVDYNILPQELNFQKIRTTVSLLSHIFIALQLGKIFFFLF